MRGADMPTNEERRDVARKLRELLDDSTYPDLIGAISDHDGWYAAADAADRLADLIEPEPERTCHPVLMDWTGNPPYYTGGVSLDAMTMGCSECGCPFRSGIGNLPNYCPNCGARVIDGVLG